MRHAGGPVAFGTGGFELWQSRQTWIEEKLQTFHAVHPQDCAAFDAGLRETLGIDDTELSELLDDFEAEADVDGRLQQLSLTRDALARLIGLRRLVASDPSSVRVEEWEELASIHVQVTKQRRFAQSAISGRSLTNQLDRQDKLRHRVA